MRQVILWLNLSLFVVGVVARKVDMARAVQQLRQNLHFEVVDHLKRGMVVAV